MAYKVNFSIPEEDKAIYEKLMSMRRNKSRYIVDLIKKDLGMFENKEAFKNAFDEEKLNYLIDKRIREFFIAQEMEKERFKDVRNAIDLNDDEDFL